MSTQPRAAGFSLGPHLRIVGRRSRVQGEGVLDVHQDELLMLLFVLQAELDDARDCWPVGFAGGEQEAGDGFIDVAAVGVDLVDAGTREHAARRARMTLADGFVVGIEEVAI